MKTLKQAVIQELVEEKINNVEGYIMWFLLAMMLVVGFMGLYTQNYIERLEMSSLIQQQEMVNGLLFKVLWW